MTFLCLADNASRHVKCRCITKVKEEKKKIWAKEKKIKYDVVDDKWKISVYCTDDSMYITIFYSIIFHTYTYIFLYLKIFVIYFFFLWSVDLIEIYRVTQYDTDDLLAKKKKKRRIVSRQWLQVQSSAYDYFIFKHTWDTRGSDRSIM